MVLSGCRNTQHSGGLLAGFLLNITLEEASSITNLLVHNPSSSGHVYVIDFWKQVVGDTIAHGKTIVARLIGTYLLCTCIYPLVVSSKPYTRSLPENPDQIRAIFTTQQATSQCDWTSRTPSPLHCRVCTDNNKQLYENAIAWGGRNCIRIAMIIISRYSI